MVHANPNGDHPQIDPSAYVHPTAVVIGNVGIGKNVLIGPAAVLRADEPDSSIIIKDNCNVQDQATLHALAHTAVLIEADTSLSHGCIIHGPCRIGSNCFIGFGSVVFSSEVGDGVCIKHSAVVENVKIPPEKIIDSHRAVVRQEDAQHLRPLDKETTDFMESVLKTNLALVEGYRSRTP